MGEDKAYKKLALTQNKFERKNEIMKTLKSKAFAILIAALLTFSMTASMILIPAAHAHTPAWNIPTYAYLWVYPNPIGIGQTVNVYAWLDPVYGAAGGTTATVGTNGYTASASLLANDYRWENYKLTITAPSGAITTENLPVLADPTGNWISTFTPTATGTYKFSFSFPGQTYGANGDGYSRSVLMGDYYEPSNASATLTVQQTPISPPITSEPLPTAFWESPIYSENSNWWSVTSNWLGTGAPVPAGYTSSTLYHGDNIGPLTSHIMWTTSMQFGGIVGGNSFQSGGSYPGNGQGAQYYEGSSYQPRFSNPIIIDGYLFYTEPISFTGPSSGATTCVSLFNGQTLWSSTKVPPLSFGYIFNLWDPDQHGTFPPILVAAIGGGLTGLPPMWECFDAYTGVSLFNITNVPGFAAPTHGVSLVPGQPPVQVPIRINGQIAATLTYGATMGPSGEVLRDVFMNDGNATDPDWYLAEWNFSRLWSYDINPYTGGGSYSPSVMNASNGVMIPTLPIPIIGETGTAPSGASAFIPYGSSIYVDGSTTIAQGEAISSANPTGKYDWNVSVPWLNIMPLQAPYNPVVSGSLLPVYEQGTAVGNLAEGGTNPASVGVCPVTVLATNYGDAMLCRNGSLPTGFRATGSGYPQLPYTIFLVNLNATVGPIGSILWMKTYNPPAGNLTLAFTGADWQTGVFVFNYEETLQWVGYSLTNGNYLYTTAPQNALDYYGVGNTMLGNLAFGKLYSSQMSGVCYCYNDLTGQLLWTWGNGQAADNSTYAGFATPYGDYPTAVQSFANGGVIYLGCDEHTILNPIYKGATTEALNATTGKQIWRLSDYTSEWSTPGAEYVVADGFAAFIEGYTNQIYVVGRGPSATTVTTSPGVTTLGSNVVIKGTVMDISAGTKQNQQAADFPNGVPCASDASMQAWMGYVYQQQAEPTNFTGVPVELAVLDSNGNQYPIGTATTDESGMYTLTWTPNIPGNFTVYATFSGTNGYWPSNAETSFNVMNAPPTQAPAASPPTGLASTGTVELGIAVVVIVIIIIGAILAVLTMRKRP